MTSTLIVHCARIYLLLVDICPFKTEILGSKPFSIEFTGNQISFYQVNISDIDECMGGVPVCETGLECINTIGSYSCQVKCEPGFQPSPDRRTCVGMA